MWQSLQGRIVRQVADYFTDLVGPMKHLHEAATNTDPLDEEAYQRAEDDFLVSLLWHALVLPCFFLSSARIEIKHVWLRVFAGQNLQAIR